MKTRVSSSLPKFLPFGAEGSEGLPNEPNLPFRGFRSQSNTYSKSSKSTVLIKLQLLTNYNYITYFENNLYAHYQADPVMFDIPIRLYFCSLDPGLNSFQFAKLGAMRIAYHLSIENEIAHPAPKSGNANIDGSSKNAK